MLFADKDVTKTKTLNAFAKELQLNNTKPLQIYFVDDKMVNAALPDIHYSLLQELWKNGKLLMSDWSLLVMNRHTCKTMDDSMKRICRNLVIYLFQLF
jgi:hypothetical protein